MDSCATFYFNTPNYNKLSVIKQYQTISIRLDNSTYLSMMKFYNVDAKTCYINIVDMLSRLYDKYAEQYSTKRYKDIVDIVRAGNTEIKFKIEYTANLDVYFTVETEKSKTNLQLNIEYMQNKLFKSIERVDVEEES